MTSTEANPNQPVVVKTPLGWTVQLLDKDGKDILNWAVFPSKSFADEELKRIVARRSQATEKPSTSAR